MFVTYGYVKKNARPYKANEFTFELLIPRQSRVHMAHSLMSKTPSQAQSCEIALTTLFTFNHLICTLPLKNSCTIAFVKWMLILNHLCLEKALTILAIKYF